MKKFLICSILFFLSGFASAEYIGSLYVEHTQSNSSSTYYMKNVNTYSYEQQSGNGQFWSKMYGTGVFESINGNDEGKMTAVPGVNVEGHSKVQITKRKRQYFLSFDVSSYSEVMQQNIELPFILAAEVKMYDGSWRKFEDGDFAFFEFTDEAKEQYIKGLLDNVDRAFQPIRDGLKAKNLTVSKMQVEEAKFNGRSNMTANLNEFNLYLGPLNYKVRYDIYR